MLCQLSFSWTKLLKWKFLKWSLRLRVPGNGVSFNPCVSMEPLHQFELNLKACVMPFITSPGHFACFSEPAEASDGTSGPDPPSDRSNSTISSPVPATPGSADETLSRVSHMPDPATLGDFQTSTASARQRAHKSPPSESTEPAQKLPAAEEHPENAPFQAYQSRNGVRDVPVPGKDGSAPVDHVKVLDQMRCGGCLLVALLTRWALSVGLGMLFLEVRKCFHVKNLLHLIYHLLYLGLFWFYGISQQTLVFCLLCVCVWT